MQSTTAILLLSLARATTYAQDLDATSPVLDANFLNVSFECSHNGKEWSICNQPDGWGAMFYCPAYSDMNDTELALVEWGAMGVPTPLSPCFTCPGADSNCSTVVNEVFTAAGIPPDQNSTLANWPIWDETLEYCVELCERNKEGESCNQDDQCTPGELFCDYEADDTEYTAGTCRKCPVNQDECFEDGFAATTKGRHNCRDCALGCYGAGASKLLVDGEIVLSQPIDKAIQSTHQIASGLLHDCSDLVLDPKSTCPGAEGKVCVVYFEEQFAIPWQVSNQAEKSGCVGLIGFLPSFYDSPLSHSDSTLLIPYVYVTKEDGLGLLTNKIGSDATIEVDVFGGACYPAWESDLCRDNWPCDEGRFCEFNSRPSGEGDRYTEGYCIPCPAGDNGELDPMACYFDSRQDGLYNSVETISTKTVQKVQECAATCGAQLTSEGCKFCTSEVTGFEFGVENEEDRCILCPEYDLQYPDRIVPLFGPDVKCWQLESFFQRLPVPKSSRNCQLAQSMNFICGCDGTGYAGAKTQTKQAVLVWLPRVAAILSMLGSLFIIVDTQRTHVKRAKLINKILCATSIFDFVGSFAMAFTTLPTPESDYIYGGKGNEKTCTAQGFMIQMGTIACFLGVSLSLYYNLTIKQGWSESKMKRRRVIYFLLVPPIVIGFTFAGIGIPYYDNVMVWCNNSARWWPEVPVILAILYSTVIMIDIWYFVYKKEKKSARYSVRGNTGGPSNKLSKMVSKQASLFIGAFYICWVPYLALQYMWSSGTGYNIYGLTLAAATMVPLQGFWNFIVYARPRYFSKGAPSIRSTFTFFSSSGIRSSFHNMRRRATTRRSRASTGNSRSTTRATSGFPSTTNIASSGVKPSSVAMESEVVPFGAPDEPEVIPFGAPDPKDNEPEVVPFGAPDPKEDKPEVNESADDDQIDFDNLFNRAPNGRRNPDDDDDARYDMFLAG